MIVIDDAAAPAFAGCRTCHSRHAAIFPAQIPRAWSDKDLTGFELPLVKVDRSPRHLPEADYYALQVKKVWKSYPVYHPDKEPAGYQEWLVQQEPADAFDSSKLVTKEDWIRAGELVFTATNSSRPAAIFRDPRMYSEMGYRVSPEGILPGYRYFVARKGRVEVSADSCSMCHSRLLDDGRIIHGAQPNYRPEVRQYIWRNRASADRSASLAVRSLFWMPWQDGEEFWRSVTEESRLRHWDAAGIWAHTRNGTSESHPVHVPSLIGIENHRYLDSTGHVRHRGIADIMRYAASNQSMMNHARYGDFQPSPLESSTTRFSDQQLYALALYLYSLTPPVNPNKPDALTRQGERVFRREGCAGCHPAPLHTNNMLTPALGFTPSENDRKKYAIMDASVGTDPFLAMRTKRGTGYYKVPPLRGVWFRHAFGHGGWCATLEDWFDPARLREDYTPTGFRPSGSKTWAVTGHEFGLKLSINDKKALIAFLKTI